MHVKFGEAGVSDAKSKYNGILCQNSYKIVQNGLDSAVRQEIERYIQVRPEKVQPGETSCSGHSFNLNYIQ